MGQSRPRTGENSMAVVWTNNKVAITKCLVFGISVMSETGWVPLNQLTCAEIHYVRSLIDHNPSFPFYDELEAALSESSTKELTA
jgi:hypothetical protein